MKDKAYKITIDPKYDGYRRGLASGVYKVFDEKTISRASVNENLAQELQKPVTKKSKRRKAYTSFKENIWAKMGFYVLRIDVLDIHYGGW